MKLNDKVHGFVVRSIKEVSEQNGVLYELEYEKNGAQLLWLDNGEQNKVFSITFKTLPVDDTGVFHIIEHSVLCGSKKYPVKDPFVNMIKNSMKTYLNAMTFTDKTMYPVASRNTADFLNLIEVYLDAVFYPKIYDNENIFYQEGWHYSLENREDMPLYKGVVFNEMKGAYSAIDTRIQSGLQKQLYKETTYQYVSGGDPKKIPSLTHHQFLETHKAFYHPSNSKIYLDGDVPILTILELLDRDYLTHFERSNTEHTILKQEPISPSVNIGYHAVSSDEELDHNAHMAIGKVLCDYKERMKLTATMILSSYLTGSNDSPLTRAIIETGLAQDIVLSVADGIAQPYCYLHAYNMNYDDRSQIKDLVKESVLKELENGLEKEDLIAAINQLEFQMREVSEPSGISRNINIMSSWLYGEETTLYLEHDELFKELRDAVKSDYYEELLKEVLLDRSHNAEFYLLPSQTLTQEDWDEECQELETVKSEWTDSDLEDILVLNKNLLKWQETPDSKEDLNLIPRLSLDEVGEALKRLETQHCTINKVPVMFHQVEEKEMTHFNLYFSLMGCSIEQLQVVSFMTNIIGMLPTKTMSVAELQREIKTSIGYIDYNISILPVKGRVGVCQPYFVVSCSCLKDSLSQAIKIIKSILNETLYESEESYRLMYNIALQCEEGMRYNIIENGHSVGYARALSKLTAEAMVKEQIEGYNFYTWLGDFVENFDEHIESYTQNMKWVQNERFTQDCMRMGITSDRLDDEFSRLVNELNIGSDSLLEEAMTVDVQSDVKQEFIEIPAGVNYATSAGHLTQYGEQYNGALSVLSTILSYDYLWNDIRVKNGAYGCGFMAGITGNIGFYSYRDPAPMKSLRVYQKASEFVREFCHSDETIDNYILSTLASMEPLVNLRDQASNVEYDDLIGMTKDDRDQIRQQVLSTTKDDLERYCDLLDQFNHESVNCIVGNRDSIKGKEDEFKILEL